MHRHRSIIATLFDKSEERKFSFVFRNLRMHLCIYAPRSNFLLHLNIMASCSGCFFLTKPHHPFFFLLISHGLFCETWWSHPFPLPYSIDAVSKHRRYSFFLDRTQIYTQIRWITFQLCQCIPPLLLHPAFAITPRALSPYTFHLCYYTQPLSLHPTFAITFHLCYYTQPLPLHIVFLFYLIISFVQVFYFCTVLYERKTYSGLRAVLNVFTYINKVKKTPHCAPVPLHPTFAITFHLCHYTPPLPLHQICTPSSPLYPMQLLCCIKFLSCVPQS